MLPRTPCHPPHPRSRAAPPSASSTSRSSCSTASASPMSADSDLGRAEDQPGQPVLPLPGQGRADQCAVRALRQGAGRVAACRRRRAQRRGRLALLPHAVRGNLAAPFPLSRPERPAEQEPQARDPVPARPEGKGPRGAGAAGRPGTRRLDQDRRPRGRAGGLRDGGGADLLAELRVRARPAPRSSPRPPARRWRAGPTMCCRC